MGFLVCKMLRQKILKYIQAKGINSLKLSILNFYVNVTCEMFFFSFPDSTFKDGPVQTDLACTDLDKDTHKDD